VTPGRRARAAGGALAAALAFSCAGGGYAGKPTLAVADGDPIVALEKAGRPESLVDPRLVPLSRHTDPPFRRERVVGVALGEPVRMYPVGLLDGYAAVNDEAAGVPFAVVRDPMTDLSVVLDRRAGGRTLTLEGSGAVWRGGRVLRDRETGTFWAPASGRGLSGPLAGEALALIPAPVTTAEAWRELHPSTLCLETGELTAVSLRLRLYASSSEEGVSGRKTADRRFPPKAAVFVVAAGNDALAFSAADVREKKSVAATLEGRALAIEWDGAVRAPRAWRQIVAARQEVPVLELYWFAAVEQFPGIRTLAP
jgi:hypothetical protein